MGFKFTALRRDTTQTSSLEVLVQYKTVINVLLLFLSQNSQVTITTHKITFRSRTAGRTVARLDRSYRMIKIQFPKQNKTLNEISKQNPILLNPDS